MTDPAALLSLNAPFAMFGKPATYTPPGGGTAVVCRVIIDRADRDIVLPDGKPFAEGDTIEVRASEVVPARGGSFVVETVTYVVQNDPKSTDPDRLAFICAVA